MKKYILNLFLAMFLGTAIGMVMYVNPIYPTSAIIGLQMLRAAIGSNLPAGILADAVDVSGLTAYAGKNQKGLIATMVNMLDMAKDVMIMPNIKNKLRIGKLKVGAGVRPFSSTEEFQDGDLQYTDRFIEVEAAKRELLIDPEEYRTTYLSEVLTAGSGANKKEIPYAQFTWREVFKAMWAEVNDNTAWEGFDKADAVAFNAGATYSSGDYITYTPTGSTVKHWYKALSATVAGEDPDDTPAKWQKVTSSALFKGFGTRITEEVSGSGLSEVAIGAIDGTAGVARGAFLELFRAMPQVYQRYGVVINCSFTDFNYLIDDIEDISKYTRPSVTEGPGFAPNFIYLPNSNNKCIVKPATWITSRRLIAGPAKQAGGEWRNQALLFGTDLMSDMNQIITKESDLWTIKAGIKFLGGTQIANLEELQINDQA